MTSDTAGHKFGPGSITGHATGTVSRNETKIGQQTMNAIHGDQMNALFHRSALDTAASEAFGPSDWYLRSDPLTIGRVELAHDLLYRPNDRVTLGVGPDGYNARKPAQVGGTHYAKLAIDPFTYAMKNDLDVFQFSVVKYVTRFRDKGGVQDLRKAIDCLQRLIAHEEGRA